MTSTLLARQRFFTNVWLNEEMATILIVGDSVEKVGREILLSPLLEHPTQRVIRRSSAVPSVTGAVQTTLISSKILRPRCAVVPCAVIQSTASRAGVEGSNFRASWASSKTNTGTFFCQRHMENTERGTVENTRGTHTATALHPQEVGTAHPRNTALRTKTSRHTGYGDDLVFNAQVGVTERTRRHERR